MAISQEELGSPYPGPASAIADYLRQSISISYLLAQVWAGKLIVIGATVAGLLYGMYSIYTAGPRFSATMSISPADSDAANQSGGGSGVGGGLLAGLTGSSNTMALPKFTEFLSSMGSIGVARELNRRYDFLCRVYKSDCDFTTHHWRERTGIREWFDGMLAKLGHLPDPNGPRTEIDLAKYVLGSVVPSTNKTNSLVTLTFENTNPTFAAHFLSAVVATTNDHIRLQNRETQKQYVEYLSRSAAMATNVEQRQTIDTLLLQEERQLMLTEVDIPYAAKVLDGPTVVPVNHVLRTLTIYTFCGFLLGTVLTIFLGTLFNKQRR